MKRQFRFRNDAPPACKNSDDGANIVGEYDSAGVLVAKYAQGSGIDEPLAMWRGGQVGYYNADGLGSVTSVIDSTLTPLATYSYDAFGKKLTTGGSLTNPFQYTGREWDQETGLYYYRARYYSTEIGRFISEDPIGFDGGANFYAYVDNRPTSLIDPSGEFAILYCDIIPASRGKNLFEKAVLYAFNPTHCYLYVYCRGKGHYLELYGPPPGSNHGEPHNGNPFNPARANQSNAYPLHPPAGMGCCEFEDRLDASFTNVSANLPNYNPLGPNSNTFLMQVITGAGGTADFPPNAVGAHYGSPTPTPPPFTVTHGH